MKRTTISGVVQPYPHLVLFVLSAIVRDMKRVFAIIIVLLLALGMVISLIPGLTSGTR